MPFYRHAAPTWYGAGTINPSTTTPTVLGSGESYIFWNVAASGAGGAPQGTQVDSGASRYTFGVAFGENAEALSVNRGFKALFQNTDYLDEVVQADRVRAVTIPVTFATDTTDLTLPADIYLGALGASLTEDHLKNVLRLLTEEGVELVDFATSTLIAPQSCSEATSPLYSAGTEVITFAAEVPAGDYLLLCYERVSYAQASREILRPPYLNALAGLDGRVQQLFSVIRGDTLDLDAAVPASLSVLLRRGVNGVYRSGSTAASVPAELVDYYPAVTETDTAGAGAWFLRDGPALTGLSESDLSAGEHLRDPLGSMWWSRLKDTDPGNGTGIHQFVGGSRGFVVTSATPLSTNAGSMNGAAAIDAFAAFVESNNSHSSDTYTPTKLALPLLCDLQRVTGDDLVTISGGNWFTKTISLVVRSALSVGQTLIEIEWSNPSDLLAPGSDQRRVYRIKEIVSATQIKIMAVDGSDVGLPASLTSGTIIRYYTPTFLATAGSGAVQALKGNLSNAVLDAGVVLMLVPPTASYDAGDAVLFKSAYAGASSTGSGALAFEWGGYEASGGASSAFTYKRLGSLRGDGSIVPTSITSASGTFTTLVAPTAYLTTVSATTLTATTGTVSTLTSTTASITNALPFGLRIQQQRKKVTDLSSVTGTVAINLTAILYENQVAKVVFSGTASLTTITLYPFEGTPGYTFEVWFDQQTAAAQIANNSTTWPSFLKFRSEADKLLTGEVGWIDIFTFNVLAVNKVEVSVRRIKVS